VDTSLIERVEVVKGPNSTLWGVNASGGVINVITKNPFERKGGFIKLGFGDYNTQNHNFITPHPLERAFT
jgi:iron complex outermembrane receptor protein